MTHSNQREIILIQISCGQAVGVRQRLAVAFEAIGSRVRHKEGRLEPGPDRLTRQVRTSLLAVLFAALGVPALVVCATAPGAAPQQSESTPSVSLNRIREGLEQVPAL